MLQVYIFGHMQVTVVWAICKKTEDIRFQFRVWDSL
jgi:hypothetical protein